MPVGLLFCLLLSSSIIEAVVLCALAFYLLPTAGQVAEGQTEDTLKQMMEELGISPAGLILPAALLTTAALLLLVRAVLLLSALTAKKPHALTRETVGALLRHYARGGDLGSEGHWKGQKGYPAGLGAHAEGHSARRRMRRHRAAPGKGKAPTRGGGGKPQVQAVLDTDRSASSASQPPEPPSAATESATSARRRPLLALASLAARTRSSRYMSAAASRKEDHSEPPLSQQMHFKSVLDPASLGSLEEGEWQRVPKSRDLLLKEEEEGEKGDASQQTDETISISLTVVKTHPPLGGEGLGRSPSSPPAPSHFAAGGGATKTEKATVMVSETMVNVLQSRC